MRRRALLLSALALALAACVLADPAPPRIDEVSPDVVWRGSDAPVEIRGSGFRPAASADFDSGSGRYRDAFQAFAVRDGAVWDLSAVTRESATLLHAVVPAGLPAAVYSLEVVDPRGREAWLTSALTISSRQCFTAQAEATADATIDAGDPDRNDGDGDRLEVGDGGGGERRALVKLDPASLALPPGAEVVSAKLRLRADADSPAVPVTALPIGAAWREHEVTWDRASSGTPWAVPGGELGAALDSRPGGPGPFVSWDVTAALGGWLAGAPADGIALVSSSPSSVARFSSREGHDPPLLKVDWCLP